MRRKDYGTLTLSPVEKEQLDLLADYIGLDPWKSPAALTRGILHWVWNENYALDRLTPEQIEVWREREDEELKEGIEGYGYSARTK